MDIKTSTKDIMQCVLEFVAFYKMLQWHTTCKCKEGLELSDGNRLVTNQVITSHSGHTRYLFANIEPIKKGIHCWRVQVQFNPIIFMIKYNLIAPSN